MQLRPFGIASNASIVKKFRHKRSELNSHGVLECSNLTFASRTERCHPSLPDDDKRMRREDLLLVDGRLWNCVRVLISGPLQVCFPQHAIAHCHKMLRRSGQASPTLPCRIRNCRICCSSEQIWDIPQPRQTLPEFCDEPPTDQLDVDQQPCRCQAPLPKETQSSKQSVHQRQQMCSPKYPRPSMPLLSHATFSPRNNSPSWQLHDRPYV